MATALQSPITVEQYARFEGYPGLKHELIHGEIVLSPQPKPFHRQIAKNISRLLDEALLGQGFTVQQNSNIRFRDANSMPAPDVFVVREEAWRLACESDDYLSTPPVLVVEILSPANRKKLVEAKVELYLNEGVVEVWMVRPKSKTVTFFSRRADTPAFHSPMIDLPAPLVGSVDRLSFFTIR